MAGGRTTTIAKLDNAGVNGTGKEALNLTLAPGESVTFRYRVLISCELATPESTEAAYKAFVAAYR